MSGIQVLYGAGGAGSWPSEVDGPKVLDVLDEFGITKIDTARIYGPSEKLIGERGAAARIGIDTKHPGGFAKETRATKENVLEVAKISFDLLKTDQVDVYYIHAPDRQVPLENTLEGINELYKQGRFKRFGLSNFLASEVEQVVQIAKEKGFVPPTVYQGNYSLIARKQEVELFPVLRKHGIAFNAYSPLAGGFLTKTAKDFEGEVGRFRSDISVGRLYITLYKKPAFLAALTNWDAISSESGISKPELANRWVCYHSALKREKGDGMITGSRTLEQLRSTLTGLKKGPLPEAIVKQIDGIWELVKDEAGLDNFNLNDA
ncbi:NADP-dependent oxidoreductase domain-containing protein [Xylariales sp. PMI_506]|nr:NADP-dependent oxidoreductase domain-containing protein [Xylariales sp. PMI_506]